MTGIPLIAHLTYALDFGGLESLLVERINRMPSNRYRHAVICLTHYTEFSNKIRKPGVGLYALHKPPGQAPATHVALWKLLRRLRPTVLHTYNLAAVEYGVTGLLAGVPVRIHGSHGREASDPEGRNPLHNRLRKWMTPFYDICYSNSPELLSWNRSVIGVPDAKSRLLNNGIDTERFRPARHSPRPAGMENFPPNCVVVGTVGRIQDVKNQSLLVDAFARLRALVPAQRANVRLAIVGAGPQLSFLREKVASMGLADMVWLPGARMDVPEILNAFSVFALPSIAEGTPGSVLEAMATALPVVATRVGGVSDVVCDGETGFMVPSRDPEAMAAALARYCMDPGLAARHGTAGRAWVERKFAMDSMVAAYTDMYDELCKKKLQGAYKPCAE